jgi:hypothetical protein
MLYFIKDVSTDPEAEIILAFVVHHILTARSYSAVLLPDQRFFLEIFMCVLQYRQGGQYARVCVVLLFIIIMKLGWFTRFVIFIQEPFAGPSK